MRHRFSFQSTRAFVGLFLALFLVGVLSCSEDPAAPPEDDDGPPPPTGEVTQTIPPAGGAISTKTQRNAMIALTFPAGAVGSPVDVTIKPVTPDTDAWLKVVLEPANIVFLKDIDVVVTAPLDVTFNESQQLYVGAKSDPVILPTTVDVPARTMHTTLRGFGADPADKVGFVPRSATSQIDQVANNIGAGAFGCQRQVDVAQQALDDFIAAGTYETAISAVYSAAACAERQNCTETSEWVTATSPTACDALADALVAAGSAVGGYGDFRQRVAAVTYWAALVRRIDPGCSALANVESTVAGAFSEFRGFFDGELQNLTSFDYATFTNLKNEARDANKLFTEALFLAEDALASGLQDDALYPILDATRATVYDLCRQDNWHYPLSNLTSVGFYAESDVPGVPAPRNPAIDEPALYGPFTDQDIWDDIQFCATNATIRTTVASGGTLVTAAAGGGTTPGSQTAAVSIRTPTRGKLILEGSIGGFTCWDDIAADNTLAFDIGTTRVRTLNRTGDEYLVPPVEFDIKQLAQQAGVVINDSSRVTMTVKRVRTNCDERLWGGAEYELLRINMEAEGPEIVITHNLPAAVDPGDTVTLDANVELRDQLGVASIGAGVPLVVSAIGATVSPQSGVTDADGNFTTRLIISTVANASAALRAGSVDVFVSITAQVDGVTEHEIATATVSGCVVDGAVVVNSQEELNLYTGVCRIDQVLEINDDGSGAPITDLSPLSELTYVAFGISISGTSVTSLAGLEKVSLGEDASFHVFNNPNLVSLDGLASQGGSDLSSLIVVTISNNPSLTGIAGIRNLMHQSGVTAHFITISNNASLLSLTGLDNVTTSGQLLTISNNASLTSLAGLDLLQTANAVDIRGNLALASLAELSGTAVTGSLIVTGNPGLAQLAGLEAVTAVAAECDISSNAELVNIDGLMNLNGVGTLFSITNNPKLCMPLPAWVGAVTAPASAFDGNGTDPSCGPTH
jgi:hypothetical protein